MHIYIKKRIRHAGLHACILVEYGAQPKLFLDKAMFPEKTATINAFTKNCHLDDIWGSDPNSGAKLVVNAFKDIAEYLNMEIAGVLGVCSGEVSVEKNDEALKKAFELGSTLLVTN